MYTNKEFESIVSNKNTANNANQKITIDSFGAHTHKEFTQNDLGRYQEPRGADHQAIDIVCNFNNTSGNKEEPFSDIYIYKDATSYASNLISSARISDNCIVTFNEKFLAQQLELGKFAKVIFNSGDNITYSITNISDNPAKLEFQGTPAFVQYEPITPLTIAAGLDSQLALDTVGCNLYMNNIDISSVGANCFVQNNPTLTFNNGSDIQLDRQIKDEEEINLIPLEGDNSTQINFQSYETHNTGLEFTNNIEIVKESEPLVDTYTHSALDVKDDLTIQTEQYLTAQIEDFIISPNIGDDHMIIENSDQVMQLEPSVDHLEQSEIKNLPDSTNADKANDIKQEDDMKMKELFAAEVFNDDLQNTLSYSEYISAICDVHLSGE